MRISTGEPLAPETRRVWQDGWRFALFISMSAAILPSPASVTRGEPVFVEMRQPTRDSRATFKDLEGRMHTPLAQPGKKATVLFFVLPDCPIVNASAPEIQRICNDYRGKNVATYLVYADPDMTVEQAKKHGKEYGLTGPALLDPTHVLVKKTGVTIAPEVAVLNSAGQVVYRGRIDDLYVALGKRRPAPTQRDLRNALDEILQGKAVSTPTTKAIGCFLPEPK